MSATHTYMRDAVPAEKTGQCPCCLKQHRSTKKTTLVRHGWKETGRVVGSYGNGFQSGECFGWGKRPLEQTDADAQEILVALAARIAQVREALEMHKNKGAESYTFSETYDLEYERGTEARVRRVEQLAAAFKRAGLAFEGRATEIRVQGIRVFYHPAHAFTFTVARGAGEQRVNEKDVDPKNFSRAGNVALFVPSYEKRRAAVVGSIERDLRLLVAQEQAIKAAVKHHLENPSNGGVDKKNRGPLVHFEATHVRSVESCVAGATLAQRTSKHIACGARRHTMGGYRNLRTTEDRAQVTCTKCRASLTAVTS